MIYLLILISLLLTLILVTLVNAKDSLANIWNHLDNRNCTTLSQSFTIRNKDETTTQEDHAEPPCHEKACEVLQEVRVETKPKIKKTWKQSIDTTIWMERFEAMLLDKEKRLASDSTVFADHKIDKARWRKIATEAQKRKLLELQELVKSKSRKEVKKSFNYGKKV